MSKKSSTFAIKKTMETNKVLSNIFIEYLEKTGAKNNYIRETIKAGTNAKSWTEVIGNMPPLSWVQCNFNWGISKEGYEYWKRINDIWEIVVTAYRMGGAK